MSVLLRPNLLQVYSPEVEYLFPLYSRICQIILQRFHINKELFVDVFKLASSYPWIHNSDVWFQSVYENLYREFYKFPRFHIIQVCLYELIHVI